MLNLLIGRLLLLTIRESIRVPRATLVNLWSSHGLDPTLLPRTRTPKDAFRKATPRNRWQQGLAILNYQGGQHIHGSSLEAMLVYSVDSKEQVDIHHTNRAILYLSGAQLGIEPLTPLYEREVRYLKEVDRSYQELLTMVDGAQVRASIQALLHQTSALMYREGTYLMRREAFAEANAIVGILQDLNAYTTGPANEVWDIPYIDTMQTRDQIGVALDEHVERVIGLVMTERQAIREEPEVHRKHTRVDTLRTRLLDLEIVIERYERLTQRSYAEARAKIGPAVARL